jgi:hypothetical protein
MPSQANATNIGASEWIRTVFGAQGYAPAKAALICSGQIDEDRILELRQVFANEVCAYAVMSNHHHVVLRVDKAKSIAWSDGSTFRRTPAGLLRWVPCLLLIRHHHFTFAPQSPFSRLVDVPSLVGGEWLGNNDTHNIIGRGFGFEVHHHIGVF